MTVPYTFGNATTSIPLSNLDTDFATPITLGNTNVYLGNTTTSISNLSLGNVTITSVGSTFPNSYLSNSSATLGNAVVTLGGTTSSVGNLTLTNVTISSVGSTFPNSYLANSSVTINGTSVALGGSATITANASATLTISTGLSGTSYNGGTAVTIAIDSTVATLTGSQTLTNKTINGSNNTLSNIPNSALTNNTVTVNGTSIALGASGTVTAAAGTLTGTTLNSTVVTSSLTSVGTITTGVWNGTAIGNTYLANSSVTVNGTSISLGGSGTVTAAAGTLTGTTLNSTVVTSSLTSVGTIATGTWNGSLITGTYGGTGVNNGSNTITIAGNVTHAGAYTQSFTATANTAVTLPAGATASSNNLLSSATAVGIVTGTPSSTTYLRGDGTWATVSASGVTTFSAGTTGFTPSTATSGAVTLSGTLATTNGGTGLTSFTANGVVYASSTSALATGSALTFDGTNLGIGTSSPSSTLQVGDATTSGKGITLRNGGGASRTAYITTTGTTAASADQTWYAGVNVFASNGSYEIKNAAGNGLILDTSANLGLGVTPSAWGSTYTALQVKNFGLMAKNDSSWFYSNAFYNGSNNLYTGNGYASAFDFNGAATGGYAWRLAPSGTAGNAIAFTQAMTLDASGNLLVGKTSAGNSINGAQLSSTYQFFTNTSDYISIFNRRGTDGISVYFQKADANVGTISVTTTATTFNSLSDYRLKNITGSLTGAKDFIMALQPKQGTWKADGSKFVGFLAHEFQEISPSSVTGEKDAVDADGKPIMQSMQASSAEVMANLISLVQEQQALITTLTARITALESA